MLAVKSRQDSCLISKIKNNLGRSIKKVKNLERTMISENVLFILLPNFSIKNSNFILGEFVNLVTKSYSQNIFYSRFDDKSFYERKEFLFW